MKFKPYPYQAYAIQRIIDSPQLGLFLDMGLGKTVITLTAIHELICDYADVHKVLVIAPKTVAESTWADEIHKWEHLQDLTISKVLGSKAQRIKALKTPADIYVINRENVTWLCEYYGNDWPFDMHVIDELSSFKNPQAKRFKALRRKHAKRVVGLTGTPVGNGLMDLWAEMYLLDHGERLGRYISHYRDRFFVPGAHSGATVFEYRPRPNAFETIMSLIKDITVSMKAEDYLTLPDKIVNVIPVELSGKALRSYKEMERDNLLMLTEDNPIAALQPSAVMNKLLQLANGFIYDEDKNVYRIHEKKLEALQEIIADNQEPVLVFYKYQADLSLLLKAFPGARVYKNDEDKQAWNRGEVPLLLAHPASTGFGLNLQDGGRIIVWFGLTWSLEEYQQANARLYRQGQSRPVIIHHIVCRGTIDEQVLPKLQRKATTQDDLMKVLKERSELYATP